VISLLWIFSKGYRLRPWRSPYLRWRIETYEGWHAEKITARDFCRFAWRNRRELLRYLRWADRMRSGQGFRRPAIAR
jgi:hypothetical protein